MRQSMRAISFMITVIAAYSIFAFGETGSDKTLSPYFLVQGDPNLDQLPLKNTSVDIAVSGVIADVTIVQHYRNEGSGPINARYIFPASTRAAVYGMRMIIGNQIIVAKVKEREKAKKEFDKAKETGKSASLLEQNRPNVFSMSVANILPDDEVRIELQYTELLVPTDGTYEVIFPTVVGPRYSSQPEASAPSEDLWVKSQYLHQGRLTASEFHLTSTISAGVPIQDLLSPSHQIVSQWKNQTTAQIMLDDSESLHSNRDFILRYRLAGPQITSGLMLYQGEDENFFLYMAQPPERVAESDIPPREYIFVVDVSGSMFGFPLDISKHLLSDLIGKLRPTDLFNVVLFAGGSRVLSNTSLPANQKNISQAIRLIDSQDGGGGTELLAALTKAMNLPRQENISRTVVLVTDGYIEAEKNVFNYIRDHLNECNVFSFGIGAGVNRYLIEGVARAGMGEPFVVTQPEEGAEVASKFREYIQTPVLSEVRVRWTGFDVYDVEPAKFPDLFARRPVILFGKWRGPVTGAFELEGETGRGHYQTSLQVSNVQPDNANRALRYLWARSRIAELSDYGSRDLDSDRIGQITSLGLTYNLLTQYTSFIAVRELVTNTQGPARDVNQPLPLPRGVSDLAVGGVMVGESEPELLWLILLLVLVMVVALLPTRSTHPNS